MQDEDDGEALAPGTVVGEYVVEGPLGRGGFGAVYRATHPVIGKSAAIKVLSRAFSGKREMASRFIAEARAVNQIRHRNIIDVFGFGQLEDGRHYYVMELLDGKTLDAHVRSRAGRLPVGELLAIFRPLARALAAAHARGIAHRDLKPENIFLATDEEGQPLPKLLDFGIAKLAAELGAEHVTRSGVPMGTPAYMSPEQVAGKNVDTRTDIYSFGVMTFEILTGGLPFSGDSMIDILVKHKTEPAPRMSSRRDDLHSALDEPVLRMMSKDPADRPQTILEAFDALATAAAKASLIDPARFAPLSGPGVTPASLPALPSENIHEAQTVLDVGRIEKKSGETVAAVSGSTAAGPRRSPVAVVLVALAVGAGGVGAYVLATDRSEPAAPGPSAPAPRQSGDVAASSTAAAALVTPVEPSASAQPSAEVTPARVRLRVEGAPADAEVFLGKDRLGKASEVLEIPRGDAEVQVEVRRSGFTPEQARIVPTQDRTITVKLKPLPGKPKEYGEW